MKLTNEEYQKVVDALTERAVLGATSLLREQLEKRLPKKRLEKGKWSDPEIDLIASLTINVKQVLGDALVEVEKVKRQPQ